MGGTSKGILIAVVTAIPVSIVTTIITNFKENIKDTKMKRKYSAILYYDMYRSLEQINFTKESNVNYGKNAEQVFQNQFTHLNKDKFFEYLVSIRDKIHEKDFNNIIVYYNNLWLLEFIRVRYWETKDPKAITQLGNEYVNMTRSLSLLYGKDEQGFIDTIQKLKKVAKIKN